MALTFTDKFKIAALEICANTIESTYYPLLYKHYAGMERHRKLRYAEGKRALLDVFRKRPAEGESPKPLFFYIHGGGWVSGKRNIRQFYCMHWADKGYVCASVGYDYALDAKHPEHLRQIFKALEFVLDRAREYGIDTGRIVVAGESAGGYLASMMTAVATHRGLYDEAGIDFRYRQSFRPVGCLLLSGIFDPPRSLDTKFPFIKTYISAFAGENRKHFAEFFTEQYRVTAVSEDYADAAFPPTFIVGSKYDRLITESESLYEKLKSCGVRSEYYVCTGINGMHAASLDSVHGKSGRECFEKALAFMNRETMSAGNPAGDVSVAEAAADSAE